MNHKLFSEHSEILHDALNEKQRQNERFGSDRIQRLFLWNTMLIEKAGEASKELSNIYFSDNTQELLLRYRKELIEVASVAIATIQDIDNNGIFK